MSPSRVPVLSFAHYFQAPATQAIVEGYIHGSRGNPRPPALNDSPDFCAIISSVSAPQLSDLKFIKLSFCPFRLVDVLRDFGKHDWQLSSMVCQILWNYR